MTVGEYFEEEEKITKEYIDSHYRDRSEYMENGVNFLLEKWDYEVTDMSEKQRAWFFKLAENIVEDKILRRKL